MPRGDGTGPMGMGPMTGRRMGYCAGYAVPGFANPGVAGAGLGMAWGRGGGIGLGLARRRGRAGAFGAYPGFVPAAPMAAQADEATVLKDQLSFLQQQVEAVTKRLAELESEEQE